MFTNHQSDYIFVLSMDEIVGKVPSNRKEQLKIMKKRGSQISAGDDAGTKIFPDRAYFS